MPDTTDPAWNELYKYLTDGKPVRRIVDRMKGTFQVGDVVKWFPGRNSTLKVGTIVVVIPHGSYAFREDPSRVYPKWRGFWRDQESYVVCVGGKLYWPRAGLLKLVEKKRD